MEHLRKLNSATKYPSIETYHVLGEKGRLTEALGPFADFDPDEEIVLTEKVDGTNIRIVVMPDGDWFIGTREDLIYAAGDRIIPSALNGATHVAIPYAERAAQWMRGLPDLGRIEVLYMEVYGHKIGAAAKNYTRGTEMGARLFDIAYVDPGVLVEPLEEISSWRDHGGQRWAIEPVIQRASEALQVPCTPRLGTVKAGDLPTSLETAQEWLRTMLPGTQVSLDETGLRNAEGIVLRTKNRSHIAKARFEDYARTLKRR